MLFWGRNEKIKGNKKGKVILGEKGGNEGEKGQEIRKK